LLGLKMDYCSKIKWRKNMPSNLGYNNYLYILPFDHRSSFAKLFGFVEPLSSDQKGKIIEAKKIIYRAFKKSLNIISKEQAAILVDEQYGEEIIKDAKSNGYNVLLTIEKSGQDTFEFEYDNDFAEHVEKFKPTFLKALIRFKPDFDTSKLKILSDYSRKKGYKFLLEILTENKTRDEAISAIKKMQESGVEPDVWKLEGMDSENDYIDIIKQIKAGGRENVKLVILGRGASQTSVENWINAGKNVDGVIGFAIGRTIFWNPLNDLKENKISEEQAIGAICDNFLHFYNLFVNRR
jgi:myo-inositol catabolism protein IolC